MLLGRRKLRSQVKVDAMNKFIAMWQQAEDQRIHQEEQRWEEGRVQQAQQQEQWMQLIAEAQVGGIAGVEPYQPLAPTSLHY